METTLPLFWREKLDALQVDCGRPIEESEVKAVYSAIRKNYVESEKRFTVRTDKGTGQKSVFRLK